MGKAQYRSIIPRLRRELTSTVRKMQGKRVVHFLHIGKTGGSAVKYVLKQYVDASPYTLYLHPHAVRLRDVPKGDGFIFFLRDPVSRFISGFYSRQRQGQPRYFWPWTPEEKTAFERFGMPNELAEALSSPDDEERQAAQKAMNSIQHVRSLYWEWFEDEAYFLSRAGDIFFIGFQDRLAEDFGILMAKLGLPADAQLPQDDKHAHRNPTDIDRSLSDVAIANLKAWYQPDYRFMALCEDIIRDNPDLRRVPASD